MSAKYSAVLLALLLATTALPVTASLMTYTARSAWQDALTNAAILTDDSFDGIIASADSITFASAVISEGINPQTDARNLVDGSRYAATVNVDGGNGYDSITWIFPHLVQGFAADWFTTNTLDGATVSVAGTTVKFADLLGSPGDGFLGFVADRPFRTATFSTDGGAGNEFFQADNLTFAAAIPEPATLTLAGLMLVLYHVSVEKHKPGRRVTS